MTKKIKQAPSCISSAAGWIIPSEKDTMISSKDMKFGLLVPSSNTTMEPEFWKMASGWMTLHAARMRLQEITVDALEEMEELMIEAAVRLADAGVDVIGYGCTSGSLFRGKDFDKEIEKKIEKETGISAVATAKAVIRALDELRIKRVCVATPYSDEINERLERYLEENGISVLNIKGLGIVRNTEVGNLDSRAAYELARQVVLPETQGIFISCTNFRTIEMIDTLEEELNVPVLSSNTATLWAMMKEAAVRRRVEGCGKLLSRS